MAVVTNKKGGFGYQRKS